MQANQIPTKGSSLSFPSLKSYNNIIFITGSFISEYSHVGRICNQINPNWVDSSKSTRAGRVVTITNYGLKCPCFYNLYYLFVDITWISER